jgi:hypothetical protein
VDVPTEPLPTVPVACTLVAADLADRGADWARLGVPVREAIPAGLRLTYGTEAESDLRRLAALERECCAWAAWSVDRRGDEVVLEVTAAPDAVPAVRELFSM